MSFSAENCCIVHLKNIGKIESVIQSEVSQKEKNQYINSYVRSLDKKMVQMNLFAGQE